MDNSSSLKGKLAYVLGGCGLIGEKTVRDLSDKGCKVIILDVDTESFKKEGNLDFVYFDCSDMENIEENLSTIISRKGIPNIFINCSYPRTSEWAKSSFKEVSLDSLRRNVDIHLNSYAWTSKLVAEQMGKQDGGSIIMLGSIYSHIPQRLYLYEDTNLEENFIYPIIKSGLLNLTRQLATFYGKMNVRVNNVCPGGLEGPVAGKNLDQDQLFKDKYIENTPLGRMARPSDISSCLIFLASDDSSYITGQSILIDGGFSIS